MSGTAGAVCLAWIQKMIHGRTRWDFDRQLSGKIYSNIIMELVIKMYGWSNSPNQIARQHFSYVTRIVH